MNFRYEESVDNLMQIIIDQHREVIHLVNIIHRIAKGVSELPETYCEVITNPFIIPDFLKEHDCDYVILLQPGKAPVRYLDREAIDRMLEQAELMSWLTDNWGLDMIAIAVP